MKRVKKWGGLLVVLLAFGSAFALEDEVNTAVVEVLGQVIEPQQGKATEAAKSEDVTATEADSQPDKAADKQVADNSAAEENSTSQSNKNESDKKVTLFTIGSGSVGGNYFALGQLLGTVISHPYNSLKCGDGGTCGVEGLQSVNIATVGSVANLTALEEGSVFTGFVQSGIAYWAYTATGPFEKKNKQDNLRAIASLYPEMVQVVVRKDLNAKTVADLKDKRVSVGTRHSGTLSNARVVLEAYGLSEDDMQTEYLNIGETLDKMRNDELDAFFITMGLPAPFITALFDGDGESAVNKFTILNISGTDREKVLQTGHYFSPAKIPTGTYKGVGEIETVSMYALWLTTKDANDELIYNVTKALWNEQSRLLLDSFPLGKEINLDSSLNGIGIPLHEGAKKYYNEVGKKF